ncbi:MAG: alpha-glucan family phosphorylase [Desulfobacterales bacterium]|nr:alpha-glucan family phosphorylase [Desulfobacterales bacterium]
MNTLKTYQVYPRIPERLQFLETLARNLWWCWRLDAIELFRRVDPRLWEQSGRNPIVFATMMSQERFERGARDESFLAHLDRVQKTFEDEIKSPVDSSQTRYGRDKRVAYFSMEFGIHESLPFFSGGLGVLAGDHLKAASDLQIPMVAVGLLYRKGYFHQYLDHEGWQQEDYAETDIFHLPVNLAKDADGKELTVTVDGPGGPIHAQVWVVKIGRVPLYLLDTNIAENSPEVREITARLYPGESPNRLAQEVVLGIGGMKILELLNIDPSVCHMNEGHSAFACIERIAQVMETCHVDLKTALEIVPRSMVFTTHTPVAAGHDEFSVDEVRPYLASYEKRLGTSMDTILSWGQTDNEFDPAGKICMFVLALTFSQFCNGVSRLHGSVARQMWQYVWPKRPVEEVPISHVTNGVHIPSWISIENHMLFERYLGPDWYLNNAHTDLSSRIDQIYNEEIWRAREMSRSRLVRSCRSMMVRQCGRRNAPKAVMKEAESVLDPEILTIGFARRFATYKRAYLLFMEPERLEKMIKSSTMPVQFIFAGKAHPKDNEGKELIKQVVQFSRRQGLSRRIIFLENYDINIARHLVQGVDVWLNTPRRPMEACGTSGMKAAVNGVLNLSILDGWWAEGYCQRCGWSIGSGEEYQDHAYQDAVEARALYNILENDVIPAFYDRHEGDTPERWVEMMKESMKLVLKNFCAHSMVQKYEGNYYLPAVDNYARLAADQGRAAQELVSQRRRIEQEWPKVRILSPESETDVFYRVGDTFQVTTEVHLGGLTPDDVEVELYYGQLKSVEELKDAKVVKMSMIEDLGEGSYRYACDVPCEHAGRFGFTARVMPTGDDYLKYAPGFLTWA